MNYRTLVKGALALSLSLIVESALASSTTYQDDQKYGAMFETTANTPIGAFNDYDYTIGDGITNAKYRVTAGVDEPYGWLSGDPEQDESKIIARTDAAGGQALQLNTDASTLTNKFAEGLAGELNTGIAAAGAFFETEVKFVPSDTLDAGITGGTDATKFAIYAYSNDQPPEGENVTTNLVVFHGVINPTTGAITYTNEVFDIPVDCDEYTTLRIEMKKFTDPADPEDPEDDVVYNAFSVKVGNAVLTSDTAFDAYLNNLQEGSWFLTVENQNGGNATKQISSLNFKGTGEIDNIKAGVIEATTTYAIDWTGSQGVAVTNAAGETLTSADTNFVAGASIYFTANALPEGNVITNVFVGGTPIDGITFPVAEYAYTVGAADTTVTVLAGVPAQEPPAGDDYAAGDNVGDVTGISAGMATWLNGLKTAKSMTKAQLEAAFDSDGYTLTEEYLLNTDPTVNTTVAFTISSIAVGNMVDLQVTLTRSDNNVAVTDKINGVLKIYGATSLDGTFAADQTLTDNFAGETTAEKSFSTQNKFFKAVIEEAPAAAPAGE